MLKSSYLSDHKRVYWYNCDGYDDRGWGCGWRVMQSVSSLLFDEQVNIEEINETLISMGFQTQTKSEKLAFADIEWIFSYFQQKKISAGMNLSMKMYLPTDSISFSDSLSEMKVIGQHSNQVVVLVCGGMIVCFDAIGIEESDSTCHFIDPHVFEPIGDDGKIPPLIGTPGTGGIGNYCVIQLMKDLVQPLLFDINHNNNGENNTMPSSSISLSSSYSQIEPHNDINTHLKEEEKVKEEEEEENILDRKEIEKKVTQVENDEKLLLFALENASPCFLSLSIPF